MTYPNSESTTLDAVVDRIARSIAVSNHAGQIYICAAKTRDIHILIEEVVRHHPVIQIPKVTFSPE